MARPVAPTKPITSPCETFLPGFIPLAKRERCRYDVSMRELWRIRTDNIYIITGDSGNGMTHGTLGGIIITDIIMGRDNPLIDIYSPSRITLKTSSDYLQEVGNMVAQYGDWFSKADIKNVDDLKPGEGGIMSSGFKKIAVYCDEENNLHTCSAVCPHLGAILQWNADEKTFDCPMHGSRFTTEGKVINGPATSDLKKVVVKEEHPVT